MICEKVLHCTTKICVLGSLPTSATLTRHIPDSNAFQERVFSKCTQMATKYMPNRSIVNFEPKTLMALNRASAERMTSVWTATTMSQEELETEAFEFMEQFRMSQEECVAPPSDD